MEGPPPPAVAALRQQLRKSEGILISTPEYAGALPGPLVNLLDWTVGGGETYGMPVGFVNAAGRAAPTGGTSAHASLRTILGYTGSEIVEAACPRVPVHRADIGKDGLIANHEAREEIALPSRPWQNVRCAMTRKAASCPSASARGSRHFA